MSGALNKEEWLAACGDLAKTYEQAWEDANKQMTDQNGYMKLTRIPAVRSAKDPNTFTNHLTTASGGIGDRVTDETATHYMMHHFWIEEKK